MVQDFYDEILFNLANCSELVQYLGQTRHCPDFGRFIALVWITETTDSPRTVQSRHPCVSHQHTFSKITYRVWIEHISQEYIIQRRSVRKYNVINGEIVPREDYKKNLLKEKDEELKKLDDYYERRRREITEERDRLNKTRSLTG